MSSEAGEQPAPREETRSALQVEDDILFTITRLSKNAKKKARKYPDATKKPVASETGTQEAQEIHRVHEGKEVQHAPAVQQHQEVQQAQEVQQSQEVQQVQGAQGAQDNQQVHEFQQAQQAQQAQEAQEAQEAQQAQEVQRAQEAQRDRQAQGAQDIQQVHEFQGAYEAQNAQELPKNRFAGVNRITVDDTRGSKNSTRGAYYEGRKRDEEKPKKSSREPIHERKARERDDRPTWVIQKESLKAKFPDGWKPRKKLSPDALAGLRALHQQFPKVYTTDVLSKKFEVSPEAIRRILKGKWEATDEEDEDRQRRWFNRGLRVWERYAELGKTPPRRWREAGVQATPWNRTRAEEDEVEEDEEQIANTERLRRLETQVKLAKRLM